MEIDLAAIRLWLATTGQNLSEQLNAVQTPWNVETQTIPDADIPASVMDRARVHEQEGFKCLQAAHAAADITTRVAHYDAAIDHFQMIMECKKRLCAYLVNHRGVNITDIIPTISKEAHD